MAARAPRGTRAENCANSETTGAFKAPVSQWGEPHTVVMNLLRRGGFRSIHAGQQELAHDISRMLALGGVNAA
jgi:hypothetical protein